MCVGARMKEHLGYMVGEHFESHVARLEKCLHRACCMVRSSIVIDRVVQVV